MAGMTLRRPSGGRSVFCFFTHINLHDLYRLSPMEILHER